MISIFLPAYKSEELLKNVFFPSMRHCQLPVEVIIRDNGGNGDLADHVLNNLVTVKIIGDGNNVGLNRAFNECARVAKHDFFYLCHTDMSCLPGWDTALIDAAKNQAPGSYLFSSRSIEPSQGHTPFHIVENYGREQEEFQECLMLSRCSKYADDKTIVQGYRMPFFFHRKLFEKMNGFDEQFISFATDDDLFLSAYNVGVRKFWLVNASLVYHLQGKSNAKQKLDKDQNWPYEFLKIKWRKTFNMDMHLDQMMQKLVPWNVKIR